MKLFDKLALEDMVEADAPETIGEFTVNDAIDIQTAISNINEADEDIEEVADLIYSADNVIDDLRTQIDNDTELLASPETITPEVAKISVEMYKNTLRYLDTRISIKTSEISKEAMVAYPIDTVKISKEEKETLVEAVSEAADELVTDFKESYDIIADNTLVLTTALTKQANDMVELLNKEVDIRPAVVAVDAGTNTKIDSVLRSSIVYIGDNTFNANYIANYISCINTAEGVSLYLDAINAILEKIESISKLEQSATVKGSDITDMLVSINTAFENAKFKLVRYENDERYTLVTDILNLDVESDILYSKDEALQIVNGLSFKVEEEKCDTPINVTEVPYVDVIGMCQSVVNVCKGSDAIVGSINTYSADMFNKYTELRNSDNKANYTAAINALEVGVAVICKNVLLNLTDGVTGLLTVANELYKADAKEI